MMPEFVSKKVRGSESNRKRDGFVGFELNDPGQFRGFLGCFTCNGIEIFDEFWGAFGPFPGRIIEVSGCLDGGGSLP